MENPITGKQPSWKDVLKNLVYIFVVIGIAYIVTSKIGLDNLREKVADAGIYAPLIIIILKATTLIVVPLGGGPLYPIAGAIFGFYEAFVFTFIGDVIGSAICFLISRRFGKSVLHYFMSKQQVPMIDKLIERLSDRKTYIKARIFFTGFPELFAYASGLVKIPFWFFIVIHSFIHAIPASIAILFGEALVSGSKFVVIAVGAATSLLALAGIFWFNSDLKKSA